MGRTLRSTLPMTIGLVIAIVALLVPFSVSCSKPPAPTAAFTASWFSGGLLTDEPIAGTAPLTVQFHNQSSGEITSWRWSLGDGTVVKGGGDEVRNFTHEYKTPNSSGYIVSLKVWGPGGKDRTVKPGTVTVFSCQEAATVESNQVKLAIQACLSAAGTNVLDSAVVGWDGSAGMVTAGGEDAADYLGVWTQEDFRATYDIAQNGMIANGTDVSWGCVCWDPSSPMGARWCAI
jgi:PKD repeat protein